VLHDVGVKSADVVAAVFVDFPKNKCNFLHKNKLDIARRVQFLTGRRPMRSFSPGAVAVIALWKSALMDRQTDDGHVAIGHICAMQAIRPEFDSQIANVSSICITANSGKNIYSFFN